MGKKKKVFAIPIPKRVEFSIDKTRSYRSEQHQNIAMFLTRIANAGDIIARGIAGAFIRKH